MGVLTRAQWILGVSAALIVGGCGSDMESDQTGSASPSSGTEVESVSSSTPADGEIPHPILEEMEPLVATELAHRRAELDDLLLDGAISEKEKGLALGRMGQLYQAHRLLDVAEDCYRHAQAYDPETLAWRYYGGVLASNRGDLDAAAEAFEMALTLASDDIPARVRLADLELDRGNLETAETLYEEALMLEPSLAPAEYGLGRLAAERREFDRAVQYFNKTLALQSGASVVHYHLGQALRQLGRADEARGHLAKSGQVRVAMADPLMQEVSSLMLGASPYLARGNAATREGRFGAGAAEYRKAMEADPGNLRARQSLASTLLRLGDLEGAVEHFEAAVRIAPDNARAQSDLGVVLAEFGDSERAIRHLLIAVELEPALQKAQLNLANSLSKTGRHDDAVRTYRRLLEIDPDHLEARSRLGTALAQSGRLDEGINELRIGAERDPGNVRVRLNLGVALAETGDYEGAIIQHLAVLDLAPDTARATLTHFNLGTFYKTTGDLGQAEEHYRRALGFDPNLSEAHFDLAGILSAQGKLVEALRHYQRVVEIRPDDATARLREATTLMRLRRYAGARRALETSLSEMSGEVQLAHALARLLASCPDASLRDGKASFSMAAEVFDSERTSPHAETLAMALAEVGRFDDAAQLQRRILEQLGTSPREEHRDRLEGNLDLYERNTACCAGPLDFLPIE